MKNKKTRYDNDYTAHAAVFGALYNYFTVADTNSRNVCPVDWHVTSDAKWTILRDYLGGSIAGGKMKPTGPGHWSSPNTGATNYQFRN
jgi:uncharacterized protein (TIGR02145 family)